MKEQHLSNLATLLVIFMGFICIYKLKLWLLPVALIYGIYQLFHKDKRIIVSRRTGNKFKDDK